MGNSRFPSSGGSGTPGGSNTEVQFNDAGSFGGDAGLTWNKAANTLAIESNGAASLLTLSAADETPFAIEVFNAEAGTSGGIWVGDDGGFNLYGDFISLSAYTNISAPIGLFGIVTDGLKMMIEASATSNNGLTGYYNIYSFAHSYLATDRAASTVFSSNSFVTTYGTGGVAAVGTAQGINSGFVIQGSGSTDNEYGGHLNFVSAQIGTGYTQSAGPVGRVWLGDWGAHGSIAVQPDALNGLTLFMNNYYNGAPADSPAGGMWITTQKGSGPGTDATHAAANTYAMGVGLGITGVSDTGATAVGWTTAIQIGGTGSPWNEAASKIGTGVHIRDYTTHAIKIDNPSGSPTASIEADGLIKGGTIQASTAYKSVDGSTGASSTGAYTVITSITVKNGLITAITGS